MRGGINRTSLRRHKALKRIEYMLD
jgi:hypothetical protein